MEEQKISWVLFGAGDEGIKLSDLLASEGEDIAFFVDNDKDKAYKRIHNILIIPFSDFLKQKGFFRIAVSVSKRWQSEIISQLYEAGFHDIYLLEDVYKEINYKSDPGLQKYKNMYLGKRCFIIGTGPSLSIKDLEVLYERHEISFASNKIFRIFTETRWRPDLYCVIDRLVIQQYKNEIQQVHAKHKLVAANKADFDDDSSIDFFKLLFKPFGEFEYPEFSERPDQYVIEGFTVTYAMLQWAMYMGFDEIILLGIDFDYGSPKEGYKHFIKGYDKPGEVINEPRLEKCLMSYIKAKEVAEKRNIKIYNATRGGKLEVYERISFDELFKNEVIV